MAEKKPSTPAPARNSSPPAPAAPPQMQGLQWRNVGIIGAAVGVLWITAFATNSKAFIIVVAVITVVVAGALVWIYRWAKKQRNLMELLQNANASPEARREALAKLKAAPDANKDVMNAIAQAQLQAQDNKPDEALAILEKVDLKKVPAPMADDVRAFRAQLYLVKNRSREARDLADEIKPSNGATPEARGMLAATVAEAWARTGKHSEALELLTTIKPDDPDYGQARVPLLYARIFASFAAGKRDDVRKDMTSLVRQDANLLARFLAPQIKVPLELQKMARDVAMKDPTVQKMAKKQQRVMRRR
jgi:tetratricopeptide (TPR) repeat protein